MSEPVMAVCEGCERAVEEDEIRKLAIPGGEGETNNYCHDCADHVAPRPAPARQCFYCTAPAAPDHALCVPCYVETHT